MKPLIRQNAEIRDCRTRAAIMAHERLKTGAESSEEKQYRRRAEFFALPDDLMRLAHRPRLQL